MMLHLGPAWSRLTGFSEELEAVRAELKYRDRQAEGALRRFKQACNAREKEGKVWENYDQWKAAKTLELKAGLDVYATRWDIPGGHYRAPGAGELLVPTGFANRLDKRGTPVEDCRRFDGGRRALPRIIGPQGTLRKPQAEAFDAILGAKYGHGLVRMATAIGKTRCAEKAIQEIGLRALFLVPGKPILEQTVERFAGTFGRNEVGYYYGEGKKHGHVTVATYQSVYSAYPAEFDEYGQVYFDEIHHIAADTFFTAGLDKIRNAVRRYGLTADEERADGGAIMVEAACGPLIYDYPAYRGIAEGFLARPTFVTYDVPDTDGSFKLWKTRNKKRTAVGVQESERYRGTDAALAYKHWVLGNDALNRFVAGFAREMAAQGQSTLVLVDELEHAEKLCALLGEEYRDYGLAVGGGKNNETVLRAFNARLIRVLVATSTLGEGADTVAVDALVNLMGGLRPKQAVGRALRNDPGEDGVPRKPAALVVDFDFPESPVLSRHYRARDAVYCEYGCGAPERAGVIPGL